MSDMLGSPTVPDKQKVTRTICQLDGWKNEWMGWKKRQEAHQETFAIILLRNQQDMNFGRSNGSAKENMNAKDIGDKN